MGSYGHLLLSGIKSLSLGRKFIHFLVNAYRTALQVQMRNCKMQKNNMVSFVWFLYVFVLFLSRPCAKVRLPSNITQPLSLMLNCKFQQASIVESAKNTHTRT